MQIKPIDIIVKLPFFILNAIIISVKAMEYNAKSIFASDVKGTLLNFFEKKLANERIKWFEKATTPNINTGKKEFCIKGWKLNANRIEQAVTSPENKI